MTNINQLPYLTTKMNNPIKKLLITIILLTIIATLHAQAPELKNMMPNSWQKLTRLSEEEEKEFLAKEEVLAEVIELQESEFEQSDLEKINFQVFTETNLGIQFFRVLMCASPLETVYNVEYKNRILTEEERTKMIYDESCIWQLVFMKDKKNKLHNFLIRSYASYWVSQGEWEGYEFNDLMIKPLNEKEIGFFITEVRVAFTTNIEKMSQNIVPINYNTCKGQIVGSNYTDFFKYNINDDINNVWNNDGVTIQASHCLFDSKSPFKYSIQNAFDGNPATSYVENTEDDLMKIDVWLGEVVDQMAIINGYAQSINLYKSNNRVRQVENYFDLSDDTLSYQYIPCRGTNVSFTSYYTGEKYNDTCIAELNYLYENNWLFGEINE